MASSQANGASSAENDKFTCYEQGKSGSQNICKQIDRREPDILLAAVATAERGRKTRYLTIRDWQRQTSVFAYPADEAGP